MGYQRPISQFDLFSSYFRPVSTLSILTVFYIYVGTHADVWAGVGGWIRVLTAAGHMFVFWMYLMYLLCSHVFGL